jgi:hypothetical protein
MSLRQIHSPMYGPRQINRKQSVSVSPLPALLCSDQAARNCLCFSLSNPQSDQGAKSVRVQQCVLEIPLPRLHNQSPTQCKTQSITKRAGLSRESCLDCRVLDCRARSSQPTTLDQLPCFNYKSSILDASASSLHSFSPPLHPPLPRTLWIRCSTNSPEL